MVVREAWTTILGIWPVLRLGMESQFTIEAMLNPMNHWLGQRTLKLDGVEVALGNRSAVVELAANYVKSRACEVSPDAWQACLSSALFQRSSVQQDREGILNRITILDRTGASIAAVGVFVLWTNPDTRLYECVMHFVTGAGLYVLRSDYNGASARFDMKHDGRDLAGTLVFPNERSAFPNERVGRIEIEAEGRVVRVFDLLSDNGCMTMRNQNEGLLFHAYPEGKFCGFLPFLKALVARTWIGWENSGGSANLEDWRRVQLPMLVLLIGFYFPRDEVLAG